MWDCGNCEQWNPASLQEVTLEKLTQVFQPFEESRELQLPSRTPSFWLVSLSECNGFLSSRFALREGTYIVSLTASFSTFDSAKNV
jgi:hypothetical protein